jgi:quinolinate synthase
MISGESLRRWKAEHPGAVVVSYINCTADVKAESDYICTSTNALKVVEAIPRDKEILFAPDQFLGTFVQQKSGRKMHLWPGYCHVHNGSTRQDQVAESRAPCGEVRHASRCGCDSACRRGQGPLHRRYPQVRRDSEDQQFIVGTEGILHRLQKESPKKVFFPAAEEASYNLKMNTPRRCSSLEDLSTA